MKKIKINLLLFIFTAIASISYLDTTFDSVFTEMQNKGVTTKARCTENSTIKISDIDPYKIDNPIGMCVIPFEEAINEYETKLNRHILHPTLIPFKTTFKGGQIRGTDLVLYYYNEHTQENFTIYISPKKETTLSKKFGSGELISLKGNTKAMYYKSKDIPSHIRFIKQELVYILVLQNVKIDAKQGLIDIANSLLSE